MIEYDQWELMERQALIRYAVVVARAIAICCVFLGVLVLSTVLFALIGMLLGGNLFTTFTAFGVRGYEATGILGAIVGAVFGLVADAALAWRFAKKPVVDTPGSKKRTRGVQR